MSLGTLVAPNIFFTWGMNRRHDPRRPGISPPQRDQPPKPLFHVPQAWILPQVTKMGAHPNPRLGSLPRPSLPRFDFLFSRPCRTPR